MGVSREPTLCWGHSGDQDSPSPALRAQSPVEEAAVSSVMIQSGQGWYGSPKRVPAPAGEAF